MSVAFSTEDEIPESFAGNRLDQVLAELYPEYSRARLQDWLKKEQILINGQSAKAKYKVKGGEQVQIEAELEEQSHDQPEDIPITIAYEDEDVLIVNKAPDMVVHPAAGHRQGTLVNALLFHRPELKHLSRAGIIHRLDKDTSGLLIVAKTLPAHTALVNCLKDHKIKRQYRAIVHGQLTAGGSIDKPIGRHPSKRIAMAVRDSGKEAVTHYRIHTRYAKHTELTVTLETGRTHQIRVHMASMGHSLIGDKIYGGSSRQPKFERQALHAEFLSLAHPIDPAREINVTAELPEDLVALRASLAES